MKRLHEWWHRAFLAERPSVSLGLFRIAAAVTVGCHMIPSFLQLEDNYLSTAFKEYNPSFFPLWTLRWVAGSPDWLVRWFVWLFGVSWAAFLVGLQTQASCLLMTLACYYFYALNSLHIGTLSFDILLVTLSLMWVTGYPGDSVSVDSLRRGDPFPYRRTRPFFIQRLLQLQIAWTFWYTALSKITAGGNWLTANPYYYLMRYPPMGVVREFPFREVLAQHPAWCQAIGIGVILGELSLPFLLFNRTTRLIGLAYGVIFHVLLVVTLHVPTIFFFLFPAQMLLFVDPEDVVAWIEARRMQAAARPRPVLLYDGRCGFCVASIARLAALDPLGAIELRDCHSVADLRQLHPDLTPERCHSRMQLVEPNGRLTEGFFSARRMSLRLPLLWPLVPLLYLPGAGWLGQRVYDWVASHRYLFRHNSSCETNQCISNAVIK
ncbi:MAG: DUF393 domain-containing protein [Candidatus Omnitrophica bacterium]|nr:DUF393 domain-containing protein [Candidatus Omnitrophota bacterium]